MKILTRIAIILISTFVAMGAVYFVLNNDIAVLNPAGKVGQQQSDLFIFSLLLSLIIIIPVFSLTLFIAIRYREGNDKATYKPDWSHSKILESIWWGVPIILIGILSVVIWQSSHSLDPSKTLASNQPPIKVQVVALQWRWLFIYPELGIATVNKLQIPTDRTIEFKITADAPMSSFWIPKLGGQIYAMPGMVTTLHLNAAEVGEYMGRNTNISGEGYADMEFIVIARNSNEFQEWVESSATAEQSTLTRDSYMLLSKPTRDSSQLLFNEVESDIFNETVNKYMMPSEDNSAEEKVPALNNKLNSGAH